MSKIHTKEGDTKPWVYVLEDKDGPVDLTNTTIVLYGRMKGDTTPKIDGGSVDILDASIGKVSYQPVAADVDTPGVMLVETRVTYADSHVERFPTWDDRSPYDEVDIAPNLE